MPARVHPDAVGGVTTIVDAVRRRDPVVKSASRVLQLLEFFDELRREARLVEISEHLGIPQSSTSALCKSLTTLGYLDYDRRTRTYLPSARVAMLGAWLHDGPVRDGRLIRMLESLSEQTGDTVIVAARNGVYSQFIHVLQAATVMRVHVPRGARRFLCWSATGFALLSRVDEEEVRALVRRTNAERESGQPAVDLNAVLAHVQGVRETGYAFSRGLVTPGAGSIAMLLPSGIEPRDRPLALGISGFLDRLEQREAQIVDAMQAAIRKFLADDPP
jgi:DNA-binding IclR family transcriptional regulator